VVDFVKAQATALRLVNANGRSVTFVDFDSTLSDPAQPWLGPADARTAPDATAIMTAVFVPPSSATQLGLGLIVNDLVKDAEQIMIVAPGDSVDLADFQEVIDADTTRWKIDGIQVLKPASNVVLAFVMVSR
jgi:hypothetical protein